MSNATYPLKLPASIKAAAARLAKEDGVSLEWIATAVAQKVGAVETAAEFFRQRAAGHSLDQIFGEMLGRVPRRPPEPGNELPKDWPPDPPGR